jgi:tetratricopeptide (TPR) repeat protein
MVELRKDREVRFTLDEMLYIAESVANGLFHLKELGIAHQDIKLDNFLITNSLTEDMLIKLADFGCSTVFPNKTEAKTMKRAGTPGYMAPEIPKVTGRDWYNPFASDIYSFGIVLYNLLNKMEDDEESSVVVQESSNLECPSPTKRAYLGHEVESEIVVLNYEFNNCKINNFQEIFESMKQFDVKNRPTLEVFVDFLKKQKYNKEGARDSLLQDIYHARQTKFENRAKKNDMFAQFYLGEMLDNGVDVKQNFTEALKWYKKSAQQGNFVAQSKVGMILIEGRRDIKVNYDEGLRWFSKFTTYANASTHLYIGEAYSFLGLAYMKKGKFETALDYHNQAMIIAQSALGFNHISVAKSLSNMAECHSAIGFPNKAIEHHFYALDVLKLATTDNKREEATTFRKLSQCYHALGEYQTSLEYIKNSIELLQAESGDVALDLAEAYKSLGDTYEKLGRKKDALDCYKKYVKICENKYGDNHPTVAKGYQSLGNICLMLNETEKALEYQGKNLKLSEDYYGESHPELASAYNSMGVLYQSLGQHDMALDFFFQSLSMEEELFGKENVRLVTQMINIGYAYCAAGKATESLDFLKRGFKIQVAAFGDSHPELADTYSHLGWVHSKLDHPMEAIGFYLKSVKIIKETCGENHSKIAVNYNDIGLIYKKLKDLGNAIKYYQMSVDVRKIIKEDMHVGQATAYENLAAVYYQEQNYKMESKYLLKVLDIRNHLAELSGEVNSHTLIEVLTKLGTSLSNANDPKEAIKYQRIAFDMCYSLADGISSKIPEICNDLANNYIAQKEELNAINYLEKSLDYMGTKQSPGKQVFEVLYNKIATLYRKNKQPAKALGYLEKAVDICQMRQGESSVFALKKYHAGIGDIYLEFGEHELALEAYLKVIKSAESRNELNADLATTYHHAGLAFGKLEKYQYAVDYYLKSLDTRQKIKDFPNKHCGITYFNLANAYCQLNLHDKEAQCYSQAAQMCMDYDKSQVGRAYDHLGVAHMHMDMPEVCIKYRIQALTHFKNELGEKHPRVAHQLHKIGEDYTKLNQHKKALEFLLPALELYQFNLGDKDAELIAKHNEIGLIYMVLKEHELAITCFMAGLDICELYPDNTEQKKMLSENINKGYDFMKATGAHTGLKNYADDGFVILNTKDIKKKVKR